VKQKKRAERDKRYKEWSESESRGASGRELNTE
jgi:hypothetical protein